MMKRARFFKRLVVDVPKYGKLAYCLVRDPRVPVRNKLIFGVAAGLIVTPFVDIPEVIPVLGELDMLALSLVALRLFIASCPSDIVEEHERAIVEQRSRFDEDLQCGEGLAVSLAHRLQHGLHRGHAHDPHDATEAEDMDEPAWSVEQERGVGA